MQNEDLARTCRENEELSEKYADLFDFAPVGYFLWDDRARILEINLAGAALLGLERNEAVKKRFGQFVTPEDRPAFAEFCKKALDSVAKQTCQVKILRGDQPLDVLIEGVSARSGPENKKICRAAIIDVTANMRRGHTGELSK